MKAFVKLIGVSEIVFPYIFFLSICRPEIWGLISVRRSSLWATEQTVSSQTRAELSAFWCDTNPLLHQTAPYKPGAEHRFCGVFSGLLGPWLCFCELPLTYMPVCVCFTPSSPLSPTALVCRPKLPLLPFRRLRAGRHGLGPHDGARDGRAPPWPRLPCGRSARPRPRPGPDRRPPARRQQSAGLV